MSVEVRDPELDRIREVLAGVEDPEIPQLSVVDLGIVREVRRGEDGTPVVRITPTYSGCPATALIEAEIRRALDAAGFAGARIETVLHPPWTTDWITETGRRKLREAGIAPPAPGERRGALFGRAPEVACPRCGSTDTERISEFGSTPCKALWRCRTCREPFEYFKCL